MNTVRLYLLRQVGVFCLATFAALLGLFWFFDFIGEVGDVGQGHYTLLRAMLYVTLQLPARGYQLLPISTLIGALLALGGLHASSEYTILRTAGLSQWRIALLLLQGGLLLAVLTFATGEWLAPYAQQHANTMKLAATNKVLAQQFRSGLWLRQREKFINIREVRPDKSLRDITMYEFDPQRQLHAVWSAASGSAIGGELWKINQVTVTRFLPQRTVTDHLDHFSWNAGFTPGLLNTLLLQPEQMSLTDLNAYIDHLRDNDQKTARFEVARWNKFAYPVVTMIMLVLAIPFAAVNARQGGTGTRLLTGVLIGIVFYLFSRLGTYIADQVDWAGPSGALVAPLLFSLIAALLIWKQERR